VLFDRAFAKQDRGKLSERGRRQFHGSGYSKLFLKARRPPFRAKKARQNKNQNFEPVHWLKSLDKSTRNCEKPPRCGAVRKRGCDADMWLKMFRDFIGPAPMRQKQAKPLSGGLTLLRDLDTTIFLRQAPTPDSRGKPAHTCKGARHGR
jgi:hypothetical protein